MQIGTIRSCFGDFFQVKKKFEELFLLSEVVVRYLLFVQFLHLAVFLRSAFETGTSFSHIIDSGHTSCLHIDILGLLTFADLLARSEIYLLICSTQSKLLADCSLLYSKDFVSEMAVK